MTKTHFHTLSSPHTTVPTSFGVIDRSCNRCWSHKTLQINKNKFHKNIPQLRLMGIHCQHSILHRNGSRSSPDFDTDERKQHAQPNHYLSKHNYCSLRGIVTSFTHNLSIFNRRAAWCNIKKSHTQNSQYAEKSRAIGCSCNYSGLAVSGNLDSDNFF